MKINQIASYFIVAISVVAILIYGKSLLIPFVFALLLWLLVRELKRTTDKVPFIKNRFPAWLKNLVVSAIILVFLGIMSEIITSSIRSLSQHNPGYEANFSAIVKRINEVFNIDLLEISKQALGEYDFSGILQSVFNSLTEILSNAFIIILYFLFIFLEESNFKKKLRLIFSNDEEYAKLNDISGKIERSIANYIGLKTLVSLITGILSFVILLIIGVDSAAFWAFLIFILNFIPTIGSLIGTLFPVIFSLFQFGELTPALMVLLFVGGLQVLIGNVLEPKLMGNSLNISSLVAVVALSVGGALWGITGMILSVPVTVILVIVFAQFEKTKPIAIMLSEKGNV